MKRACIFVDGENFRYSLKALFDKGCYTFSKGDYLPKADWHGFFKSIAHQFNCELLRTYWYVVEHVDCRPYKIPGDWKGKAKVLGNWYGDRIRACASEAERHALLCQLENEIESSRITMEKREKGWREIQSSIESRNDQLEFRRSGSIPFDLVAKQFGTEKGVDTQLATDVIELAAIYDAAVILSGDADYLPAVAAVKRKGRLVYSVSFLSRKGKQLPGGARRLSNAVDSKVELSFEVVRAGLSIESRTQSASPEGLVALNSATSESKHAVGAG